MVEIPAVYQGFWGWARGDSPCPAGSGEIKIAAIHRILRAKISRFKDSRLQLIVS
jgi:hypothetical protein